MEQRFKEEQNISKYHSYGINAKARFLTSITSEGELQVAIAFAKERKLEYLFLGKGSNLLFRNDYYPGLIIVNKMTAYQITGTIVYAESGVSLPLLCRKTAKNDLSGLEALVGVPGTVGGSVFMNAGVSGNEISKHLISVRVLKEDGKIIIMDKNQCAFAYRKSIFHEGTDLLLGATFSLSHSAEAKQMINQYLKQRVKTQPIEMKNSGCVFKNPVHEFAAGQLIDQCGLKGLTCGGAEVSTKHANFINNQNNATFADVFNLMNKVQERVLEEVGVKLECEVRII